MSGGRRLHASEWLKQSLARSYFISFAAAFWFQVKYSVDVPVIDAWNLTFLLYHVATGRPILWVLLQCNNEHPILFPKLIWIALAFATRWNDRVFMAVNLLVVLAMFLAIVRIASAEGLDKSHWTMPATLFVQSLLIFSFVHYDDWLRGFMLTFVLANTSVVLAVCFVYAASQRRWLNQMLAWICCIIASFSALQGMLSWLVIVPIQLTSYTDRRWRVGAAAGSMVLLAACIAVYFGLMTRSPYPSQPEFWHQHPIAALEFFCALLGAPLAHGNWLPPEALAPCLGFALIAIFVVSLASLFRSRRWPIAAPWVSLGLFALGCASMTTLGRSSWGVQVASSLSRYMGAAVLLAVADLQMARQAIAGRGAIFLSIVTLLGVLSLAGSISSIPIARAIKRSRSNAAAYLEVLRYIDPATDKYTESCLFPLFPVVSYTGRIRPRAEELDFIGFRKIVRHVPFFETPTRPVGMIESVARRGDTVETHGWVAMGGNDWPKVVLISIGDARLFVTAALARVPRAAVGTDHAVKSYWSAPVPTVFLHKGESLLKAWLYDSERQEFVRLGSSKPMSVNIN